MAIQKWNIEYQRKRYFEYEYHCERRLINTASKEIVDFKEWNENDWFLWKKHFSYKCLWAVNTIS